LVGEICCFNFYHFYAKKLAFKHELKLRRQFENYSELNINNDALMNAWMGWELLNADEAVDISYWDNYEAVH
jgi:hypothetical protein